MLQGNLLFDIDSFMKNLINITHFYLQLCEFKFDGNAMQNL